jgi:hypothetical protein
MYLNNAVWDIDKGTILKLAEGGVITHAVLGLTVLTKKDIEELYGKPAVFEHLAYPETSK